MFRSEMKHLSVVACTTSKESWAQLKTQMTDGVTYLIGGDEESNRLLDCSFWELCLVKKGNVVQAASYSCGGHLEGQWMF